MYYSVVKRVVKGVLKGVVQGVVKAEIFNPIPTREFSIFKLPMD
jgi:hypothetical protein